jgi:hypothetical protein
MSNWDYSLSMSICSSLYREKIWEFFTAQCAVLRTVLRNFFSLTRTQKVIKELMTDENITLTLWNYFWNLSSTFMSGNGENFFSLLCVTMSFFNSIAFYSVDKWDLSKNFPSPLCCIGRWEICKALNLLHSHEKRKFVIKRLLHNFWHACELMVAVNYGKEKLRARKEVKKQ